MTTEAKVVLGIALATVLLLGGLVWSSTRKQAGQLAYTTEFPADFQTGDIVNDSDYQDGNKVAKVTIVNFSDYECPYCREVHPIFMVLRDDFTPDELRLVWRHLPITEIHQQAYPAAVAAQAALKQGKFKEFSDALFNNVPRLSEEFYQSLAQDLGLNIGQFNQDRQNRAIQWEAYRARTYFGDHAWRIQTPTIYINGVEYTGERTKEAIEGAINSQLAL